MNMWWFIVPVALCACVVGFIFFLAKLMKV